MLYVSGGNFYPICGTHDLPFGDGYYTLTHDSEIIFTTRGG